MRFERAAADVARGIQIEGEMLRLSDEDFPPDENDKKDPPTMLSDKVKKWGRVSEGLQRIKAIPDLARSKLTVLASALDADPLKFNCENGTIHIVPGEEGRSDPLPPA